MVLTCMEEAKRLVDKAYKERRERWGAGHCPALGKAFRKRSRHGEFVGGVMPFVCLGVRTASNPSFPWPCLCLDTQVRNLFIKAKLLPVCVCVCTVLSVHLLGWGSAQCVCPPSLALTPPFSKQHQVAASQWIGQPHGTPVLLQAASGSH